MTDGDAEFTMQEHFDSIAPRNIASELRKQIHEKAAAAEMRQRLPNFAGLEWAHIIMDRILRSVEDLRAPSYCCQWRHKRIHDPADLSMERDAADLELRELLGAEAIHRRRWAKSERSPLDALRKRGARFAAELLKAMRSDGALGLTLTSDYSRNSKESI